MKELFLLFALLCFSTVSIAQDNTKKITLLWDSSYGMSQKNLGKEITFLNSYFRRFPSTDVQLKVFSNDVIMEENYQIRNGNWEALKNELTNVIYDGAASYDGLFNSSPNEYILVSDGLEVIDELPQKANRPVNIICSTPNANIVGLRNLSILSGGVFINASSNKEITIEQQKLPQLTVTGVVSDNSGPLSDATVLVKGGTTQTSTNARGEYSITASKNNLLQFSFIGKQTMVLKVPDSGVLNISMTVAQERLNEVLLTAQGAQDEYVEEEVNTGYRKVEKRKLGYGIESISEEDISDQDINLETAITGQFSNIDINSDQNISQYLSRGKNMSILLDQTGLVIIDGVPIESNPGTLVPTPNTPFDAGGSRDGIVQRDRSILSNAALIDPNNIESITVLKGLAATNKYGTLGRNGVLLVTTKTAAANPFSNKRKNIELGTTATYTGDAQNQKEQTNVSYINALKNASDINDAYTIYLRQRENHGNSAKFFMDVAEYFTDWNNQFLVERILSNVAELPSVNKQELLALAYKYDELENPKLSVSIYERILIENPTNSQNYRNLALAYIRAGNTLGASNLYRNIDRGAIEELKGVKGIQKVLATEFNNFTARRQGRVLTSYADPNTKSKDLYDKRIVFEWNAFDAEFDLQIVNPQNRFFTWPHTQEMDGERIEIDMSEGSGLEEFFLTNEDVGEWLFNITYFGKIKSDNSTPTYLKITTYTNYGKANQTEKTKVITMDEPSKKETVLKVKI